MNYQDQNYDSDELDYSGGLRRKQKLRPSMSNNNKRAYYKISMEYPTQPGYGVNRGPQVQAAKGGYISRSKVRKNESLLFMDFYFEPDLFVWTLPQVHGGTALGMRPPFPAKRFLVFQMNAPKAILTF